MRRKHSEDESSELLAQATITELHREQQEQEERQKKHRDEEE